MARSRSPNYPAISLTEAINKIGEVYKKDHLNKMSREVVAKHLGYTGLNGASMTVISALVKYGLLESQGDEVRVSREAVTILVDPQESRERIEAIKTAALRPTLFAELYKDFGGVPSEENLVAYLQKRGFKPNAAAIASRAYRDSLALVTNSPAAYDSGSGQQPMLENPSARAEGGRSTASTQGETERMRFTLSGDRSVRILFGGPDLTNDSINELIEYLKLSRRTLPNSKLTFRHRHYKLKDGRWHSGIHLQEWTPDTLTETQIMPAEGKGIFSTEDEAKAYNESMFRWAIEKRQRDPEDAEN